MGSILPDIDIGIKDGGLGIVPVGEGALGVVGVCSNNSTEVLILSRDSYKTVVGEGPLRDFLDDFFSMVNVPVYARGIAGATAGIVSTPQADSQNTGAGALTAAGSPFNAYKIGVEIKSEGTLNEATFVYSVDGVLSKELTIPTNGNYVVPSTGVTLTFSAGNPSGGQVSFAAGDKWDIETTEPLASNADILSAVDSLVHYGVRLRSLHIAGSTSAAFWSAFSVKLLNAEDIHQYIWGSCEARYINEAGSEDLQTYISQLTGPERGTVVSIRLMVVPMWLEVSNADNGSVQIHNAAGKLLGRIYAVGVALSPGATKLGPLPGVNKILPDALRTNPAMIKALQDAGYATVRYYDGKKGVYVNDSELLSDGSSDYDISTKIDTVNKARNIVRDSQFKFLKDNFDVLEDGSVPGLDYVRKTGEQALSSMKKDKEISSARIYIDPTQNILATKKLVEKIYITPRGSFNEIEAEISYENPLIEV